MSGALALQSGSDACQADYPPIKKTYENIELTIQGKLTAMSLIGLSFVLAVRSTGFIATRQLSELAQPMTDGGVALRSRMQADQAHDALRADVLAALITGAGSNLDEAKSIRSDLEAHGKRF